MVTTSSSQIHHFSRNFTGIRWSNKNQRYVTEGFNKEIANYDIEVPKTIRDAVNQEKFRINDNYPPLKDDIVLIGREIGDYAVLAAATLAIDDGNRPLVAYKYYWKEKKNDSEDVLSEDVLSELLNKWRKDKKPWGELSPNKQYSTTQNSKISSQWINNFYQYIQERPFIFDGENCQQGQLPTVQEIHELAKKLKQDYNIPISWAWNVTSLDCPESFNLICCADQFSYQWIITNNKSFTPIQRVIPNSEREMYKPKSSLKNALNNIAKNSNLESNLTLIAEQLEVEDNYDWPWPAILDNIVLENYQDTGGIRYRAMLLLLMPVEKLDDHIKWLAKKENKKNRQELIIIQEEFIRTIQKYQLKQAEDYLNSNCTNLVEQLLMLAIDPEANNRKKSTLIKEWIKWLLLNPGSLWQEKFSKYGEKLLHNIMSSNTSSEKGGLSQWVIQDINEIRSYEQKNIYKKYKFLAELFVLNQQYILASLFYQLSLGEVPQDIYQRCELKTIIPLNKSQKRSGLTQLWLKNIKESIKNWLLSLLPVQFKRRNSRKSR
ncbi:hypothetical protein [Crocosphaera sp.]|uniref:hypothetical protein n=1 Tax=Crocosphaera sp. TaxID=2729996 RepID=UPI00262AD525|nr:hypothetical protein [Crocosphaera sp.]MDJ0579200.1 hypothetical protein [Crocosphaera sp.]